MTNDLVMIRGPTNFNGKYVKDVPILIFIF